MHIILCKYFNRSKPTTIAAHDSENDAKLYIMHKYSSIELDNSGLHAIKDLLKVLPLSLLHQLGDKSMEGLCATHEGCQVVD